MNIDVAIVIGFLILNLGVGLYYGRGVKNIKDYALGNSKFNTSTLVATIVATWIGGSGFALSLSETYSNGIWYIFAGSGYAFNLLVVAYLFNKRIPEYKDSLSVAETMGKLYGKKVRIITAIASIASTIAVLALQIKVFSTIFGYFLGVSSLYATIISSFVVITYSAIGGIKAVTFTDVIQLITFGVVIPIFAVFIWKVLANQNIISDAASSELFNYEQLLNYNSEKSYKYISIFLAGLIPALNPTVFQRMLMTDTAEQIKSSFFISSFICLIIYLLTCLIGFVVYFHDPNLSPQHLALYVIDNFSFIGIKSFALIGIMAMIMSTADSWINTSSVIFSHDLCKPLGVSQKYELILSRLFALFIGVGVVLLILRYEHLLELLFLSENFYIPVITPILMLAIWGVRSTSGVALIAISVGICTTIIWKNFVQPLTGIESVVPGMLANFIAFFGSHYLFGSTVGQNKSSNFVNESEENVGTKKNSRLSLFQTFRLNFLRLLNLKYYNKYLPKQESTYHYFVFAVFLTILVTLSITKAVYDKSFFWINFFQAIAFSIATLFLCRGLWAKFVQSYLGIIWCVSIFISLAFVSIFLVLMSNFSYISLTIMTLHLVMISILVGWRASLVMIVLGLWLAFYLYTSFIGEPAAKEIYDLKVKLLYILFMAGGFAITVLKSKQEEQEATEAKVDTLEEEVADLNEQVVHYSERVEDQSKEIERLGATAQRILNNVNHELRLPVGNVMNFAEILNDGLGKFNEEQLKMLSDEVYQNSNRLSSMIMNMLDLATLEAKKIELNKSTINFGELVQDRVQLCRKMYLGDKKIDFEMQIEEDVLIKVDPNYMRQTVDNLVINAINFSTEGVIRISVLRKGKGVEFIISDNGIGIPKEDLYDIFTPFKMGSNAESKAEGRGVGLALCKAAVEAHGGSIIVASKDATGAQFRFVL